MGLSEELEAAVKRKLETDKKLREKVDAAIEKQLELLSEDGVSMAMRVSATNAVTALAGLLAALKDRKA